MAKKGKLKSPATELRPKLVEVTPLPERAKRGEQAPPKKKWASNKNPSGSKRELVKKELMEMTGATTSIIPKASRDSLTAWLSLYMEIEVRDGSENTYQAKKTDLQHFLTYMFDTAGSEHCDQWTKAITNGFMKWRMRDGLKPETINRALRTLRHASRWVERRRPFLAGNPTDKVREYETEEPEWKGLTDTQVTRLKSAAEQLVKIQTHASQQPIRNQAIFLTLLWTGLRVSEALSLSLKQFNGKHFTDVKRKGRVITRQLFVPAEAREAIEKYLEEERGRDPGPLFQSKSGKVLGRAKVHDAFQGLAKQANAHLAEDEQIEFSAHILRHTHLRRLAENNGVQYALKKSGHRSDRYIWRYVQPSSDEEERAAEDLF